MNEVVPGVHILSQFPRRYLNAYLLGDVLVDAGTRQWGSDLVDALRGRGVEAHALTHAHPDHQGSSARVCEALDVPLWCHERERDAAETGHTAAPMPEGRVNRLLEQVSAGPGHTVERTLCEGDELAGFEIVETPGNAPGHVSVWRESDGTLILGDVLANLDLWTLRRGLTTLPERFTWDRTATVRSARTVGDLAHLFEELVGLSLALALEAFGGLAAWPGTTHDLALQRSNRDDAVADESPERCAASLDDDQAVDVVCEWRIREGEERSGINAWASVSQSHKPGDAGPVSLPPRYLKPYSRARLITTKWRRRTRERACPGRSWSTAFSKTAATSASWPTPH